MKKNNKKYNLFKILYLYAKCDNVQSVSVQLFAMQRIP